MHTIVNGYFGKTNLFFNDNYSIVINECSFTLVSFHYKKRGFISDYFPGIPPCIDSSFKSKDGNFN